MLSQIPHYWDVAIDGIQIMLCLLILVLLIRNRRKNRKSALEEPLMDSGQGFSMQIFTQTVKQQADQAFTNIANTIAAERRNLDKVLANSGHGGPTHTNSNYHAFLYPPDSQRVSPLEGDAAGSEQLHEQIQNMAVKGMPARQISEELKTPLGEVELVLSLHKSNENQLR